MKKFTTLLIATTIFSTLCAQSPRMNIGIESAGTLASIKNLGEGLKKSIFWISPGFTYDYFLSPHVTLKTGLAYERNGCKFEYVLRNEYGDYQGTRVEKLHLNYLSLPLVFSISSGNNVKFYIDGGGFLAYLINAKSITETWDHKKVKSDVTWSFKRLNAGIKLGMGINIPLNEKLGLDAGLKSSMGLVNISTGSSSKFKTTLTGIFVGLKYVI